MNAALKHEATRGKNAKTCPRTVKAGRRERETPNPEKRLLALLKKGDQEALREIINKKKAAAP